MRRRELLLAVAGATLVRPIAAAQSADPVRLVAMLMPFGESDPEALIRSTCRHLVRTRWGRERGRAAS